jgi:RNA polymerase sigma-70 factor, ECF subfamily
MRPTDVGAEHSMPGRQNARAHEATPSPQSDHPAERELEWIRRIASGDRSAFEQLFHAYQKRLFGYLFRLVGRRDVVEELTNDVMVGVWKGAAGFKGESKLSTWIFGIAHFRAISWLRRANPEVVDIDDAEPLRDPHDLQEETLMKESTGEEVRRALSKLTPQHREVMDLTFYQEFSYPEIAAILGCPVNTVKTRMFYARKELRQLLVVGGHHENRTWA